MRKESNMKYKELSYSVYSESEDGKEAENTGKSFGKWSLIWWLLTNQFNKGSTYSRRKKIIITLEKHKISELL